MKILSRLLVISMCLLSLNISNAQTANFMKGQEVFEYFKNLRSNTLNPSIIDDEEVTFYDFFDFLFNSYDLEEQKYFPIFAYKIVKNVDFKGKEGRYIYTAHKNNLIEIKDKTFNLYAPLDEDTLFKAVKFLEAQNLKLNDFIEVDIYDDLFYDIYSIIESEFYFADRVTKQKLFYGAIKGMVDSLEDKHSSFQTPSESQKFHESLNQELI